MTALEKVREAFEREAVGIAITGATLLRTTTALDVYEVVLHEDEDESDEGNTDFVTVRINRLTGMVHFE